MKYFVKAKSISFVSFVSFRGALILGLIMAVCPMVCGQMVISEWMYSGDDGEFVEFTNVGDDEIDMTGWSFDDSSQAAGTVDLSGFGVVEPGESVILTDAVADDFITAWGLNDVTVVGGSSAGLGRNDQINLYDSSDQLVDQLSYGDEDYVGTPRTKGVSCNVPESDYDLTVAQTDWSLSTVGNSFGAWSSGSGDIASPGRILGFALSDYDMDGDVDLADLTVFVGCYLNDNYESCGLTADDEGVIAADADEDYDVDLIDFAVLASCYSGKDNPAEPLCGCTEDVESITYITLNEDSIAVDGSGVTVDGTVATITDDGIFNISGILNDGQIAVDCPTSETVEIILDGVDISNSTSAAINVIDAKVASIVLADGSQNYLSDADEYVYEDPEEDEPSACLFSDDTMTISGSGELTVDSNYNDAIVSKDELIIYDGVINVTSVDDGIRGKDYLLIEGGDITLVTEGDALKSDNDNDPNLGYITIEGGTLDITSAEDGIAAETDVAVLGGDVTIVCGGGSTATLGDDVSAKGIKGGVSVVVEGGTIDLDCADDGLHCDGSLGITDGTITIASGDDAIHADTDISIDGGTITITDCYEAIEGASIAIADGDIDIASDEDAITADTTVNISGGEFDIVSGGGYTATLSDDYSAKGIKGLESVVIDGGTFVMDCADDAIHSDDAITINLGTFTIATGDDAVHSDNTLDINGGDMIITDCYEGLESAIITINDGDFDITSSDDGVNVAGGNDGSGNPWDPHFGGGQTTNSDYYLYINGGRLVVDSTGDGLDANGNIVMTGGTVIVNGPTANNNGPLDYDGTFDISGGVLVATGSSGMAQAPSNSSSQSSVKITYNQSISAGTLVHIQTSSDATEVLTFAPSKTYQSCVYSGPDLLSSTSYKLYSGGSSTGVAADGLYEGGTYTAGTLKSTFTTSSTITNVRIW